MINTVSLLPVLDNKLIALLRSLSPEDWNKPTIAKLWTVKDIAAHLLDGNVRTLSLSRDSHSLIPDREINSYESLLAYLNQLNADWVKAMKRMSPQMLTDWLEVTGKQYSEYMATLDPEENAIFSVAWAGEDVSKNWFHIAREYTEKWHHQQQIREATGKESLLTKDFFYPFIETLLKGLPHTYRNTAAPEGTTIEITIDEAIGGSWFLEKEEKSWSISSEAKHPVQAALNIPPAIAWKLFTKGVTPADAEKSSTILGDRQLAAVTFNMIAIMG